MVAVWFTSSFAGPHPARANSATASGSTRARAGTAHPPWVLDGPEQRGQHLDPHVHRGPGYEHVYGRRLRLQGQGHSQVRRLPLDRLDRAELERQPRDLVPERLELLDHRLDQLAGLGQPEDVRL